MAAKFEKHRGWGAGGCQIAVPSRQRRADYNDAPPVRRAARRSRGTFGAFRAGNFENLEEYRRKER